MADKKIGLIDVDGKGFPNIPLMKLSAWHKERGDKVEFVNPLFGSYDKVYMSKVFSFTPDYCEPLQADQIIKGGTGYDITTVNGKEIYIKGIDLDEQIERMCPDYSLYKELTKDKAYGILTRGCPRNCHFCIITQKEGHVSHKVASLKDFWNGQKNIVLSDPNILACKNCEELLDDLKQSGACVDFNQGIDIRKISGRAHKLEQIKSVNLHFAWDRYRDKDVILPKFKEFRNISAKSEKHLIVYTLTNFDTTEEQDLERIYTLREIGYWAYVMIYNKDSLPKGHRLKKMQRWVNNRRIFAKVKTFDEYLKNEKELTEEENLWQISATQY